MIYNLRAWYFSKDEDILSISCESVSVMNEMIRSAARVISETARRKSKITVKYDGAKAFLVENDPREGTVLTCLQTQLDELEKQEEKEKRWNLTSE